MPQKSSSKQTLYSFPLYIDQLMTHQINFQLDPQEYGLEIFSHRKNELDLTQYCQVSEVYREPLSATSLSIAMTAEDNTVSFKEKGSNLFRRWPSKRSTKRISSQPSKKDKLFKNSPFIAHLITAISSKALSGVRLTMNMSWLWNT